MRPMEVNERFPSGWKFLIVKDANTPVEAFLHEENAEHALQVLNDHEEKYGRGRPYSIRPRNT